MSLNDGRKQNDELRGYATEPSKERDEQISKKVHPVKVEPASSDNGKHSRKKFTRSQKLRERENSQDSTDAQGQPDIISKMRKKGSTLWTKIVDSKQSDTKRVKTEAQHTKEARSDADETKQIPKQPAYTLTAGDELSKNQFAIGHCLYITKLILDNGDLCNERINYISQFKKWKEILEMYNCRKLTEKYNFLMSEKAIDIDEKDSGKLIDFLCAWMDYLQTDLGVCEYHDASADENGNITVTYENRGFYDNGIDFVDNTVCKAEKNAWVYNGEVYYKGHLTEAETEPPEEKSSEESVQENE